MLGAILRVMVSASKAWMSAAVALGMLASAACAGSRTNPAQTTDLPPAPASASATALPTANAKSSAAEQKPSALVTNSGISLGTAANTPPSKQDRDPDLRRLTTERGSSVLVPSDWMSKSPVTMSQNVCADSRCVNLDESLQLFLSADGKEAVGVMSIALPLDAAVDAASLLPGALRGSIAALSALGDGSNVADAAQPATVTNARRALSARVVVVDPTSGEPSSVTVVAAAGDHEIDALLIGASDAYLRGHQDLLDRIRSSFILGGPVQ